MLWSPRSTREATAQHNWSVGLLTAARESPCGTEEPMQPQIKINTYTELMGESVDMNVALHLLGDVLVKSKTPIAMVKAMCEKMSVSYDEICGNSRTRRLVRARQIMMAALKEVTNLSLTEIGNVCGGRDHATVVYALNQIESQKSTDLILGAEIADMVKLCK